MQRNFFPFWWPPPWLVPAKSSSFFQIFQIFQNFSKYFQLFKGKNHVFTKSPPLVVLSPKNITCVFFIKQFFKQLILGLVHTEHVPEFLLVCHAKLLYQSNSLLLDEQKVEITNDVLAPVNFLINSIKNIWNKIMMSKDGWKYYSKILFK